MGDTYSKRSFQVLVDNADRRIQYQDDSWFSGVKNQVDAFPYGPAYRGTLHGTNVAANISLTFNGSSFTFYLSVPRSTKQPRWECFLDGIDIGISQQYFCSFSQPILNGKHTATLKVYPQAGQTIWFDYFQYSASPNATLDHELLVFNASHPEFRYDHSWFDLNVGPMRVKSTSKKGASFLYDFEGVSLEWYTVSPKDLLKSATTISYKVDGELPKQVSLKARDPKDIPHNLYHIKLFGTETFPMGKHTLSVTFNGDFTTTPLILWYLVVQNGISTSIGAPSTSTSTSFISSSTHSVPSETDIPSHGAQDPNVGVIVGSVIGALFIVTVVMALVLRYRRRSSQSRTEITKAWVRRRVNTEQTPSVSASMMFVSDLGSHREEVMAEINPSGSFLHM